MSNANRWTDLLDDEDLSFLKRFVLASGSLKDLAAAYGISYPTVRLRLDRLIAKVQVFDSQLPLDEFERTIRSLHIDGKIDAQAMKTLLNIHYREKERDHATDDSVRPAGPVPRTDRSRSG